MATAQAAYAAEKAIGHDEEHIKQDVTNYKGDAGKPGPSMLALTWQGKGKVHVGKYCQNIAIREESSWVRKLRVAQRRSPDPRF
jgi:hypothetical protein